VLSICLINQKGGCGKSSTCFHLAGALAELGQRVLLVDTDPQGSLGQAFFGSEYIETIGSMETLTCLFEDHCCAPSAALLVKPTLHKEISIVCANQTLAPHNAPSPERSGLSQFALAQLLEEQTAYDVVLIDCPPNLYLCSWNALVGAHYVVIPVPPEDFGAQGLRAVHQAIEHAGQLNPRLRLLGHLVTRFDRRLLVHRAYEAKLRDQYGPAVLETVIPEASAFKVALACRKPVAYQEPASRGAGATMDLALEILDRVEQTEESRGFVRYGEHSR